MIKAVLFLTIQFSKWKKKTDQNKNQYSWQNYKKLVE